MNKKWLWGSAIISGIILGIILGVFDVEMRLVTTGPLVLGVFAVYMLAIIWTSIRNQKNIIKILMVQGQPDLYLQRMNLLKAQIRGDKFKRLIEINIATGLIYEGKVDDAIHILESLSLKGFSPMHKGVYYNNLAFAYLMQNRVHDSQEIFKKHIGEMLAADRDPMVKSCARCNQAILDYKQKRIHIAHDTLDRLLEKDLLPLQKAVILYYKGLIMKELGKDGICRIFEESSSHAGNTVFKELSDTALNSVQ